MDCVILETVYLKANGVFPCHDDAGEVIPLARLDDGFSLRDLLDHGYDHMRRELEAGRAPWPGTCERCGFYRPHEAYRPRTAGRITTFQVEPTLLCTLACPGCSRASQVKTRPGPRSLTLDRFEQVLKTAVAEGIEIACIEYCGQGEPLAHREFHGFVARARQVMPHTRQRLITNGNYDYGAVMQGQHLDEIIVSCDGATPGSYPVYRRHGEFARVQRFIADATRATPRPFVIWKYILFDFNDSTDELQRAQELAIDYGADVLMFVVTHSEGRSQRYTPANLEQLLKLTPFASVYTTAILESAHTAPSVAHSVLRPTRLSRIRHTTLGKLAGRLPGPIGRHMHSALHVDETRVIDAGAINVRGWAHDGRQPFEHLSLALKGRGASRAALGLRRPDVRRVFPQLQSDRVGFAATFDLGEPCDSAFELELRATPRGSTHSDLFHLQVTRRDGARVDHAASGSP